jgi:UDP-glucuronate 4-epimerase
MSKRILITGAAGFIGYHTSRNLLESGHVVVGVDNLDGYYDRALKRSRLENLLGSGQFDFERFDIRETERLLELCENHDIEEIVHLAARPGVRASSRSPDESVENNVNGFLSILEVGRKVQPRHLVFASSSSVYGSYCSEPESECEPVSHPASLYAATKMSNEAMAHSYAQMYGLPVTGLRFFTVYGPWGRPDMAYYLFADAIMNGETIDVYNFGDMARDFTYVGDIVRGISMVLDNPPVQSSTVGGDAPNPSRSQSPYELYNIGRGEPVQLLDFIETLEEAFGRDVDKHFCEMPPGDVESTHADTSKINEQLGFEPEIDLEDGIERFAEWYLRYRDTEARAVG